MFVPQTGMTAPTIEFPDWPGVSDTSLKLRFMKGIFLTNLIGNPGVSVPVGYDNNHLPIGLHLMGQHWGDAAVLRLAHALEVHHLKHQPPEHVHHVDFNSRSGLV